MNTGNTVVTLLVLVLFAIVLASMYLDPKRLMNAIAVIAVAVLGLLWFQNSAETRHDLYVAFAGTSSNHSYAREEQRTPAHKPGKKLASSSSKWGDM